jgi:hypothetical protein
MRIAVPFLLEFRRVPANPTQNGRVIDADLALGHKARDIARGELVLEVPAHGDDDGFCRVKDARLKVGGTVSPVVSDPGRCYSASM